MKDTTASSKRPSKDRSDKYCVCGGHNQWNHKKNKQHHATKAKLKIRKARKWKCELKDSVIPYLTTKTLKSALKGENLDLTLST